MIREHVNRLQQEIRKNGMDLTLLPGMELLCTGSLEKHLEQKDYIPLADSHYLLTEFYFDESKKEILVNTNRIMKSNKDAIALSELADSAIMLYIAECKK